MFFFLFSFLVLLFIFHFFPIERYRHKMHGQNTQSGGYISESQKLLTIVYCMFIGDISMRTVSRRLQENKSMTSNIRPHGHLLYPYSSTYIISSEKKKEIGIPLFPKQMAQTIAQNSMKAARCTNLFT